MKSLTIFATFFFLNLKSCPNQKSVKKKNKAKFSEEDGQREGKHVVDGGRTVVGFNAQSSHHATWSLFPLRRWGTTLQPTRALFEMKRGESQPCGALTVFLEATGQESGC